MKKFCTKCGKPFEAAGREVICPACKEQAAEEAKRAAVLRAKARSWTGESVPVRISGRASTVIRAYGKKRNLPFAQALDMLLQASDFFREYGKTWGEVVPYKSRRMKQEVPQEVLQASKASASKVSKAAGKAAKTSKTVSKK